MTVTRAFKFSLAESEQEKENQLMSNWRDCINQVSQLISSITTNGVVDFETYFHHLFIALSGFRSTTD